MNKPTEKILITSALPYVNNIPHIGNIVGSHLPADIFARFMRIIGYDVTFVGGADEHGTPIEIAARKKNLSNYSATLKITGNLKIFRFLKIENLVDFR